MVPTISISQLVMQQMGLQQVTNESIVTDFQDSRLLDSIIDNWKRLKPDVIASNACIGDARGRKLIINLQLVQLLLTPISL